MSDENLNPDAPLHIRGLNHLTMPVKDRYRAARFYIVVLGAEAGKAALLCGCTRRRWPRRLRFEHLMKLLMRAILLGVPRRDPLRHDAEANPPDGER